MRDQEPWTGSRADYVKSVAGMLLLSALFGVWGFVLVAIGGAG
jgi:hypothetical protein